MDCRLNTEQEAVLCLYRSAVTQEERTFMEFFSPYLFSPVPDKHSCYVLFFCFPLLPYLPCLNMMIKRRIALTVISQCWNSLLCTSEKHMRGKRVGERCEHKNSKQHIHKSKPDWYSNPLDSFIWLSYPLVRRQIFIQRIFKNKLYYQT